MGEDTSDVATETGIQEGVHDLRIMSKLRLLKYLLFSQNACLSPDIPVHILSQDTGISPSHGGAWTSHARLWGQAGTDPRVHMCQALEGGHTEALWECGEDSRGGGFGAKGPLYHVGLKWECQGPLRGRTPGPEGLGTREAPESSPLPPSSTTEGRRALEGVRGTRAGGQGGPESKQEGRALWAGQPGGGGGVSSGWSGVACLAGRGCRANPYGSPPHPGPSAFSKNVSAPSLSPFEGTDVREKADYCQRLEAVTGALGEGDPIPSYSQPGGSRVIPSRQRRCSGGCLTLKQPPPSAGPRPSGGGPRSHGPPRPRPHPNRRGSVPTPTGGQAA